MRKGQVTLYIVFIIVAVIIITMAAVLAPMGVLFNTKMYEAGEQIIQRSNESIQNIQNLEVRSSLEQQFDDSLGEVENNIELNNDIFKYGWIIVLIISAVVIFLLSRQLVEFRAGGGLV